MSSTTSSRGFTLIETLIATGILVTTIAGVAQLLALSVRSTRESGQYGVALVAAQDKLECLRSLKYGFDDSGQPAGDAALVPSPLWSLAENAESYVEWLDHWGRAVDAAGPAEYVRRWRITEIDEHAPSALAIEVCVFKSPVVRRGPVDAEACLATVRTRQP